MPSIVQFTHPGGEHGPDRVNGDCTSWNTGMHKRKFLECEGSYIDSDTLNSGILRFWGEWEPPSRVEKLNTTAESGLPKWLHRPIVPVEKPVSDGNSYQNTDPFVFGDCFRYLLCKQNIPKTKRVTRMANLDKGSVILFGSTKGRTRSESVFRLDTVFVVSEYIDYDPSNGNLLLESEERIPLYYKDIVYKMAFPEKTDHSLPMRCYFGATYDSPVCGMYSYAPSQVAKGGDSIGFPRVQLSNMPYVTNNLNSKPRATTLPIEQIAEYWKEVKLITEDQGCFPGVQFSIEH